MKLKNKIIKKILLISTAFLSAALFPFLALADENISQRLSGFILLQVESKGEAWYVNPVNYKRYYLGRPEDAFNLMKSFGLGVSENDFALFNRNGAPIKLSGKIILRAEAHGEAYYIYPKNLKLYYLGRPEDAFAIMKNFGLGIVDNDLSQIFIGYLPKETETKKTENPAPSVNEPSAAKQALDNAAENIRTNNKERTLLYFATTTRPTVEYTMNFLSSEGKLILGNVLSGAKLTSRSSVEETYTAAVGLGGWERNYDFHVRKQADGKWLLMNL